jgi:hypothetical protein
VLARIAAFAATDRPLAYFMGLRRVLGLRQGPDDTALTDLLSLRPEGLLERHRDFRNRDDWQRFFRAGGQFATLPQRDRSVLCCQVAIEHDPRLVKYLPLPIIQAHPALLLDAAGRDGRTLESMPFARIQPGNPFREALVEAAYASPRPPRIQHVPSDRLTEARCLQSLKWAPLDLPKVPDNQITLPMCLASIRHENLNRPSMASPRNSAANRSHGPCWTPSIPETTTPSPLIRSCPTPSTRAFLPISCA